jgi:ribonuclease D
MPCKDAAASAEWILTDAELRRAVEEWQPVIGLDTEFQRTSTFYPLPGLYQVISGESIYLIDPLSIRDFAPLVNVLEDPGSVKIVHACGEDLELLQHHLGAAPRNLFDTQLANAFQCADFSTSYANLVAQQLGVALDKHETRSDWRQRPLSEEQVRYALEDVVYLPALYDALRRRLDSLDRLPWFEEAMAERGRFAPVPPEEYYRTLKNAWRLGRQQLGVLARLCTWREHRARAEDVPRNRIVWDEHLYTFACRRSLGEGDVWSLLPKPIARRYAGELVAEHAAGLTAEPPPPLPKPLSQAEGAVSKVLREIGRRHAEALDLAQELLARKRDVEACVRHFIGTGELSPDYSGWRAALVGIDFRRELEQLA